MAKEDDIRKGVIAIVVIVALVSFAFLYAGSTAEEVTFEEEGDMIGLAASKLPGYDRCTRAMVGKYACFKDAEWKCSKKRKRFGTAFRWIKTGEECGRTIPRQPQPVPVDCKELGELSGIKYNECEPIGKGRGVLQDVDIKKFKLIKHQLMLQFVQRLIVERIFMFKELKRVLNEKERLGVHLMNSGCL